MLPSTNKKNPYAWQGGDTSTFAAQAKNLGEQVGNQGLDLGQIDVQRRTAEAQQKAAQTAQNVAAGSSEVAKGATVDPTIAYGPGTNNPSDMSNPKIEPYKKTKEAPAEPDTTVKEDIDYGKDATYEDPTQRYLESIFPQGIPDSIRSKLDDAYKMEGGKQVPNPEYEKKLLERYPNYYELGSNRSYMAQVMQDLKKHPIDVPQTITVGASGNSKVADDFQAYLDSLKQYQAGKSPQDVEQYKNAIKNQLNDQLSRINTAYQKGQMDLATQNTEKQKAISDYIEKLQSGVADYKKSTQDLSNVGDLSESELSSAARNAILAGDNVSGASAISALSHGGAGGSRLAALSQQAQNAAIQQAMGEAGAAQAQEKSSEKMLEQGQKAQQKSYDEAGKTITKNQEGYFKKLSEANTDAQKQLNDVYNNTTSALNKQEQDFVDKAQDTLKNSNVPEGSIKSATQGFAEMVKNRLDKGDLSQDEKMNLKKNLESIWRIAVGTNKSGIEFSNQISDILLPLAKQLGEGDLNAP